MCYGAGKLHRTRAQNRRKESRSMKITYRMVTVLLCLFLVFGGYLDITHHPKVVAVVQPLGYPPVFPDHR